MKPSTELFDLIQSLDKKEIAYFRKAVRAHDADSFQYIELFEAILAQSEYDEVALRLQFEGQGLGNWFAVAKKYLYDRLMVILEQYTRKFSAYADTFQALRKIEILYQKGLLEQATKLIDRAQSSLGNDLEIVQLLLLDWKKRILKARPSSPLANEMRLNIERKGMELQDEIRLNHEFWRLLAQAMEIVAHPKPQEFNSLRAAALEMGNLAILREDQAATTLEAKITQQETRIILYHRLEELDKMAEAAQSLVALMDTHSLRYRWDTYTYFFGLVLLLNAHINNRTFAAGLPVLEKAQHGIKVRGNLSPVQSRLVSQNVFSQTMRHLVGLGLFPEAIQHFEVQGHSLATYLDKLSAYNRLLMFPNIAWAYLGLGNLSKAMNFAQESYRSASSELYFNHILRSRIIETVIQVEMGDRELLPYSADSLRKWMESHGHYSDFGKYWVSLLRKLANSPDRVGDATHLRSFLAKVAEGYLEPSLDMLGVRYFDVELWAQSRLEQIPFGQFVSKLNPVADRTAVERLLAFRYSFW